MVLRKRNAISRQKKGETFFTGKIRIRAFDP